MPSVSHLTPIHLGLDVHKDTISVGILPADQQVPDVERIPHDEASIRRLVGRLGNPRSLRACYEAGPTGFELARLLHSLHVRCEVIAPSLIPKAPGDKARDRPAGLPAAGPVAPRRRAGLRPHPNRPRGGRPGSLPHQRRHGGRPHPCPQPAGEIPAAPWAGVAGRVNLDARAPGVARVAAVRAARHGPDVRALPGRGRGPQRAPGRGGGRPCRLVRPPAVRLAGRPAGRLPRHHQAGRADAGCRGR